VDEENILEHLGGAFYALCKDALKQTINISDVELRKDYEKGKVLTKKLLEFTYNEQCYRPVSEKN